MLKPTKANIVVFLALVAVVVGPLVIGGSGPAAIAPVLAMFWLDGLGQALGLPVSVNGGVDAFNLVPPSALGLVLILLGSAVSVIGLYMAAGWLVSLHTNHERSRTGAAGDVSQ